MASRNYYYLVAGLPDLMLEQGKLTTLLADFKHELRQHLHQDDYRLVQMLFAPADHRNLINLLLKHIEDFDLTGNYSFDELEEAIKDPELMPGYLGTFIARFKAGSLDAEMSQENRLASMYFDHLMQCNNTFICEWFRFEMNVRNILLAMNARKYRMPFDNQLIGHSLVTELLKKSNARDFGLTNEFPTVEKLLQINEASNVVEREKLLDILRWNYIDELNTFNYFSIEVILGYLIKLGIVERWMKLDKKTGEQMFKQLLTDLQSSYEFSNEFNV